jgi:AraC family transcriptional regulator
MPDPVIRCAGHGIADYPPGGVFGPRTLRDFEFVWIIAGAATWEADGVRLACPPGTVVLARPGMRDRFIWDEHHPSRHGFVHFSMDPTPDTTGWPSLRMPAGEGEGIVRPLLRHVLWLLDRQPAGWQDLVGGAIRQALAVHRSGADAAAGEGGGDLHPVIDRALAEVARAWTDDAWRPLPLRRLARAAGVTPSWLTRIFVREVGCAPVEALRRLRLDRAAQLLARGDLAIAAIAERAGFTDPFHFSRAFRSEFGCPPREFRRRLAEGGDLTRTTLVRVRHLGDRLRSARRG